MVYDCIPIISWDFGTCHKRIIPFLISLNLYRNHGKELLLRDFHKVERSTKVIL